MKMEWMTCSPDMAIFTSFYQGNSPQKTNKQKLIFADLDYREMPVSVFFLFLYNCLFNFWMLLRGEELKYKEELKKGRER